MKILEDCLEDAKNGTIQGFVIAYKKSDGDIATGYAGANLHGRQEMVGHLQADIIIDAVSDAISKG